MNWLWISCFCLLSVRWPCPPSSWLICPLTATSCRRGLWRQSATCWTSWTGFWTADWRWVPTPDSDSTRVWLFLTVCFTCQCQGGNSVDQRVRRFFYDSKVSLTVSPAPSVLFPVSCLSDLWPLVLCLSSSCCSARLRCSAASWSASRSPSSLSSSTSAVRTDPTRVTTTIVMSSRRKRTKSLTDEEDQEEDLKLFTLEFDFTVHHVFDLK